MAGFAIVLALGVVTVYVASRVRQRQAQEQQAQQALRAMQKGWSVMARWHILMPSTAQLNFKEPAEKSNIMITLSRSSS